ncbi:hypothetical protein V1509DRAFT_629925 [Lipomyces kononenkoae]
MDDLLDLTFTSAPVSQPATATGTPQLPVYKSSTAVSSQPSLSASVAASPAVSRSSTRNDLGVPPKKPGDDSFASLVSFSTAKKQAAANRSLNEQLKTRGQISDSSFVNTNADDWASGLSFDVLDGGAKSEPSTTSVLRPANIDTDVNLLDDEDILGPLAQAVTSAPEISTPVLRDSPQGSTASREILSERSTPLPQSTIGDSRDLCVAELVDMGFGADQARRALAMTDNGLNVQQAVDILVNEAHEKAKQSRQRQPQQNQRQAQWMSRNETAIDDDVLAPHPDDRRRTARRLSEDSEEQKYQDEGEWQDMPSIYSNGTTSDESGGSLGFKMPQLSGQNTAHDLGKLASGLSAQLRSRAEVLWKQGRERVAKAVEEYNSAGGFSGMVSEENPRWMRNQRRYRYDNDAQAINLESPIPEDRSHESHGIAATLEAMLLEQEGPYKQKSPSPRPTPVRPVSSSLADTAAMPRPASLRHDKPQPPQPRSADIPTMPRRPPVSSASTSRSSVRPALATASPAPKRPSPPARPRVDISPIQMEQIGVLRTDGLEAFKRGDFTQANELYSKSLDLALSPHLLRTVLLSNRAACLLKLGNIKDALVDAEEGLDIIGPTRGIDEEYEPGKSLVEIWAKLIQRKSEALEQLERFKDARNAWDELVQAGRGGKVAIDGKRRCENILNPKPKSAPSSTATSSRSTPRPTKPTSIEDSVAAQAALKRLQKLNDEAEAHDAEKFALHDTVEQKLAAWRSGKEDNLRALIGSLDTILWAETGWTKVSMADLVVAKKVKINYMKAVAKTHPDKISASATTEQKMIAQGVFVSLNRAWDEFKRLNNIQ